MEIRRISCVKETSKMCIRDSCTIEPNVGMVSVPDERLEKLAEIYKPDKFTPAVIEFVDIAGLVKLSLIHI